MKKRIVPRRRFPIAFEDVGGNLEACNPQELFLKLDASPEGLTQDEAERRWRIGTAKAFVRPEWWNAVLLLCSQFKSPLVLLLVVAVGLSAALGDTTNALIILFILLLTGTLGFWQEYKANRAVKKLQALVRTTVAAKRDGKWQKIMLDKTVPGDLIRLTAGDLIPGDCLLLKATDLHVNEATLTGESFPVEKRVGASPPGVPLNLRSNVLFEGSSIVNGEAEALVAKTGDRTELGKITRKLQQSAGKTAFEQGVTRFGYFIMQLTFFLAVGILVLNLFFKKPVADSILFSLALAVGIAPELLPAIMVTTLSAGAERMARKKVIVKKLSSIQNLGAINILCSDKTGTLTTGEAEVHSTLDINGQPSGLVRQYAWLNATFESGFFNPLDEALRHMEGMNAEGYSKFDEVPWDFIRKRLSIVVEKDARQIMITKGALQNVLDVCTHAEDAAGKRYPIKDVRKKILENFRAHSAKGFRTLGLAWKVVSGDPVINKDDEQEMIFLGFIYLFDPPKPDIREAIKNLDALGVTLKIITGDNHHVARHIAYMLGMQKPRVLTGIELRRISDEALPAKVMRTDIFAEVEPNQKDRIIDAFRNGGNVTGYIGDGINDATALRAADVGISVDSAVDVAKEASDMILLEKNLDVLREGVLEGRKTYLNTLKYIFVTTSANFGNMFSLAVISLFIPFLPLLPQQILLLNFLSDIPALGIAGDKVDEEQLYRPKRWNVHLIRRFMTLFGFQSSLFDFLTFAVLLWYFRVDEAHFQSGWFVESALTELLILLIVRTARPALHSRPGRFLLGTSLLLALAIPTIPYLSAGAIIGFKPLPLSLLAGMIGIAVLYGILVEQMKKLFFKKFEW
ncbi:MAG: magnesium-translocating P-type ATPase [Saprospiraceae bacterium]|nr:magnesium-translocating P-type ATPase [Saprospiraceae bacterium]